MQIEVKQPVDIGIRELNDASYSVAVNNFLGKKKIHGGRINQDTLNFYRQHSIESGSIVGFGAFVDEDLIGFAAVSRQFGETDFATICVLPKYRSYGIGTALADKLIQTVDLPKSFTIGATNTPAIRVAINSGLKPTGSRPITTRKGGTTQALVFDSE